MGEEEGAAVAVVPRALSPRAPSICRLEASRALGGGHRRGREGPPPPTGKGGVRRRCRVARCGATLRRSPPRAARRCRGWPSQRLYGGELRRTPLPASRESRGRQRESGGGGELREREWVRRGADRERVGEAATMVRGMWVMCFSETLTPSFYIGDGYWASVWVSWASTF